MSQAYSDRNRQHDPYSLPDVEVWYAESGDWYYSVRSGEYLGSLLPGDAEDEEKYEPNAAGWYWRSCFPGCLPDSDPFGPFETEDAALADCRESAGEDFDDDEDDEA